VSFVKNTRYYTGTVYEWNIPTGSTCPFAKECRVSVNRETGKFNIHRGEYKCYAANAERFPGVRESRWKNYEQTLLGVIPEPPKGCRAIRIHAAGDFYNQRYFDMWPDYARQHPSIEMWAYTKSLNYWVARIDDIPNNLTLTASYGGRLDELIEAYKLKNVVVYPGAMLVTPDRPIDTNDDYARMKNMNFALVDNFAKK
jgi:hypothetical protein